MRGTTMRSRMWTLLVFSAIFHLLLAQPQNQQLNFGDMVSVSRHDVFGRPLYLHWAIYVGIGQVDGLELKLDNQDIFHINRHGSCEFGTTEGDNYIQNNYLNRPAQTRAQIIAHINQLQRKCDKWRPLSHNCEHVATLIHYGFERCEQRGTWVEGLMQRYRWIMQKLQQITQWLRNQGKRSLPFPFEHGPSLAAAGA